MQALEKILRAIEMDGLVWGAGKLVPLAFGIKKLQINLVVEDEKVSIDDLQAQIEEDEEHVQSTDVVSSQPLSSTVNVNSDYSAPGCHAEAIITSCLPYSADIRSQMHSMRCYFKCCATKLVPIHRALREI